MTCDTWHVTCDTWHVTRGIWHVTCLGGWTFSQNFSSLALTVCDLCHYEDLEEKDDWVTDLMNDRGVCRTAPATPGLLKIGHHPGTAVPNYDCSQFFQWVKTVWGSPVTVLITVCHCLILASLQTLLHLVQMTLSYFLMLVAMTYNTWLFGAVLVGATAG